MKHILPLVLFASILAGCSKSSNEPAPTSIVGTWTWAEQDYVTTPKNGGVPTTIHSNAKAYTETYTFDANGGLSIMYNSSTYNNATYSYNGSVLTIAGLLGTSSFSISELSAHRLTWTEVSEDNSNRYALTETLLR